VCRCGVISVIEHTAACVCQYNASRNVDPIKVRPPAAYVGAWLLQPCQCCSRLQCHFRVWVITVDSQQLAPHRLGCCLSR
jgi:hypothetical protein